ncbi:MAG: (2Fe-2S)-binding protein [Bacteroidales bacterium]|nr:(2Fe-2S)-binding protein [Bacteroidales bacterium]
MRNENYICNCQLVTVSEIEDAVEKHGAATFEAIQNVTKVSTGCRRCYASAKSLAEGYIDKVKKTKRGGAGQLRLKFD